MSGGHFDYKEFHIQSLKEEVEGIDLSDDKFDFIEDKERMQEILDYTKKILSLSYVYTKNLDRFMSGDYGETSFYHRLKEDLDNLKG